MNKRLSIAIIFSLLALFFYSISSEKTSNATIKPKHSFTLGITQGITEFLPVSSTGHMILVNNSFSAESTQTKGLEQSLTNYLVLIQLGTILVLIIFYRKEILRMLLGLTGKDKYGLVLFKYLMFSFVPFGIVAFLIGSAVQKKLYSTSCVAINLFLGGIIMLLSLKLVKNKENENAHWWAQITEKKAFIIGLAQIFALLPGTSRSMVTILGAIAVGLSIQNAVRFSFLLGLLTSTAASTYTLLKAGSSVFSDLSSTSFAIGCVTALIAGYLTLNTVIHLINKKFFAIFAIYRCILASIIYLSLF